MKGDQNPIVQALHRKKSKGPDTALHLMPMARTFELRHHEIPNLKGKKVGEPLSVHVHGTVHSQHEDGHAMMNVESVKEEQGEPASEQSPQEEKKEIHVRTQQTQVG